MGTCATTDLYYFPATLVFDAQTWFRRIKPDFVTFSMLLHSATEGGENGEYIDQLPVVLEAMGAQYIRPNSDVWPKLLQATVDAGNQEVSDQSPSASLLFLRVSGWT